MIVHGGYQTATFVFDQTDDGRQIKCLTVVDEFTREGLAIEIGRTPTLFKEQWLQNNAYQPTKTLTG